MLYLVFKAIAKNKKKIAVKTLFSKVPFFGSRKYIAVAINFKNISLKAK